MNLIVERTWQAAVEHTWKFAAERIWQAAAECTLQAFVLSTDLTSAAQHNWQAAVERTWQAAVECAWQATALSVPDSQLRWVYLTGFCVKRPLQAAARRKPSVPGMLLLNVPDRQLL